MTVTESSHAAPSTHRADVLGRPHEDCPKGPFVRMVEDSSSLGTLITDEVYGWHTCRTIAITDLAPAKLLTGRLEALNQEISLRGWVETDRAVFERGHGGVPGSTRFTRIRICKGLI